ncbi:hypothetical protein [Mitsuaria sp. GD03876]|uniref:hypothetical protein n=1 Tax=Mitsuaria sp. GD03876 TaxID=2975399 RepID=UPI00244B5366|nr:hypothetical protein [Mitsuaria sp. GD03876]MDH0862975.1 hypothetical protein [Mitsuaria sp. GD03876]
MFEHVGMVAGVECVSVSEHGQDCIAGGESIPERARSIDIVRPFELKLAREAKQQAIQT